MSSMTHQAGPCTCSNLKPCWEVRAPGEDKFRGSMARHGRLRNLIGHLTTPPAPAPAAADGERHPFGIADAQVLSPLPPAPSVSVCNSGGGL